MKPQFVFSFLRIATSILFYLMVLITIAVFCVGALSFYEGNTGQMKAQFTQEVMVSDEADEKPKRHYSEDGLAQLSAISNRYRLEFKPNSDLGYYFFGMNMLNLLLVMTILWQFRRIFGEANVVDPFKKSIFRRLVVLSILFAASDLIRLIHYLVFGRLVHRHLSSPSFDLITELGNGLITGLIVYAIAVIYQRGIVFQEENALTV
ncbi:DUF2975 domain-containing protein [Larkinella insperata]|uniref:DUF2975 domain-containing protein n=1 Tax=Larkinella insperata TaxID=332158 RepID=A0ABW3PZ52_9BACT|nr:DUF2975 domain-containing protein [Larkinella insperata]